MSVSKPYVLGLICARGGSKGVPRKNLRLLGGKPLIAWSVEVALRAPSISRLIVSTDDPEIAAVARAYGAEVPFLRPAELAQDTSPEWLVWQHAIRSLAEAEGRQPEILVNIPPTSPLRQPEDVESCVARLLATDADIALTVTESHRNPHFNMVTFQGESVALAAGGKRITRRQDAPPVFDITTVAYAARSAFVLSAGHIFEGNVTATVVPPARALDIDTELDFAFAEFLLGRGTGA